MPHTSLTYFEKWYFLRKNNFVSIFQWDTSAGVQNLSKIIIGSVRTTSDDKKRESLKWHCLGSIFRLYNRIFGAENNIILISPVS